ncbi:Hypothetical protein ETEE_2870 [Edwardsiella anguillarum ET080813]|uniref:Uncharacterized protein n=1 Tax=Edwardsiella anguillarum ET080813 TaxID=667120 RepID=A0A076LRJ9_9GAMM|nr:Hypothetical protein ETEE_2870 [Edwardsiella anguillarum ET080813]
MPFSPSPVHAGLTFFKRGYLLRLTLHIPIPIPQRRWTVQFINQGALS